MPAVRLIELCLNQCSLGRQVSAYMAVLFPRLQVDDLDFAMRKKNEAKALKALEKAKAKLDATLAKLS